MVREDKALGALALEDAVRPESRQAVQELHRLGKRVVMLTGDARQVAEAVAADLGVDEVFAEVLPEDKDQVRPTCRAGACRWPWSATSTTPRPGPGRRRHRHRGRHRRGH